jgi:hypothetical protein
VDRADRDTHPALDTGVTRFAEVEDILG